MINLIYKSLTLCIVSCSLFIVNSFAMQENYQQISIKKTIKSITNKYNIRCLKELSEWKYKDQTVEEQKNFTEIPMQELILTCINNDTYYIQEFEEYINTEILLTNEMRRDYLNNFKEQIAALKHKLIIYWQDKIAIHNSIDNKSQIYLIPSIKKSILTPVTNGNEW